MANTLDWLSDNLVELRGPVNIATDAALATILSTSSATVKLFDTELDCRLSDGETFLTEDAEAGASSIFVAVPTGYRTGTEILIDLDSGRQDAQIPTTVNFVTGEFTLTGTLISAASKYKKVRITTYDAGSTNIHIDDISGWEAGMTIEISLGDGTFVERTLSGMKHEISCTAMNGQSLGVDTQPGAVLKRKLGADISMADFGTFPTSDPVPGDPTWGFRGTINSDHADLALGMRVRAEITAVDTGPTPDLNLFRKVVGTIINQ